MNNDSETTLYSETTPSGLGAEAYERATMMRIDSARWLP